MINLFVYGSLILDKSPIKLIPLESVFILEHKLKLKSKTNSTYLLLQIEHTGKTTDIVSGYLTKVDREELEKIDKYEGSNYQRKEATIFKRDHTSLKAFVYIAKD